MLEYILAGLLPVFFLLLFNRVLFSKYVPLLITLLILVFGFDGFNRPLGQQIIALVSTAVGFWLGLKIFKKQNKKVR
ncbi:DUF2198 family protein [Fictibacillus iocasae]|uniref:DUF2198 family protein n=1 Tax=Fictibacillus iocasae TaxID=2715437 RepID=A0ABW2NP62_9BACL